MRCEARGERMTDLIYVLVVLGFFLLSAGYARLCREL